MSLCLLEPVFECLYRSFCYTCFRSVSLDLLRLALSLHNTHLSAHPLSLSAHVCFVFVLQVGENFVPPLLDAVLIDYQRNVPAAREPEVLSTMATIVNKLGGHITGEIPQIFDAVFECTLNMINKVSCPYSSLNIL